MGALVLEGGTFRTMFACGVMDALLDNDIHFPYVVGVSAGISYGVSYVSKQKGRNLKIIRDHRHDKKYVGLRNFFTDRSLFGIKYVRHMIFASNPASKREKAPGAVNEKTWSLAAKIIITKLA